ncbi:hypothetical protein MSAN_00419400 [Mycena sanguinolenta]|uniref:Uncharacterized protein n=1 Tax=Mycena sanguinolenta TaxID=230812 RepID=A0A8H7DI99_9AGAR|nr:hypothetical protein MSAN_00419400 [Mycena sanguinolenta]
MFEPFQHINEFYPGLILWCDPKSPDMEPEGTALQQKTPYGYRPTRELRPCLVVDVDQRTRTLKVARLCATEPTDTRRWIRIDTSPPLTWKLQAWIWVGTPATVNMILHDPKSMHPHKDTLFTTPPVCTTNIQNYRVHRQNYLNQVAVSSNAGASTFPPQYYSPGSTMNAPLPPQFANTQAFNNAANFPPTFNPAHPGSAYYNQSNPQVPFNAFATQYVSAPPGFTEPGPNGWWRNPTTGWFWSAGQGVALPPAPGRGA